jgi:L-seryl-tRNA(Ser) seleniumtransferase
MEVCGAKLREVGATNKTHLRDYEKAIGPETRALLKVHTSNFRIQGFTASVPLGELTALAHGHNLPVLEDLGSGCLVDLEQFGLHDEPTVRESVLAGVDLVSFSGDKLLGGPQAGIIVGKARYVKALRTHPLYRAMRLDKMTLAALEATLRAYNAGVAAREIPTLSMLGQTAGELCGKAHRLCALIRDAGVAAEVVAQEGPVGGGSVPTQVLATYAVSIRPKTGSLDALEKAMREWERPIIGRIAREQYLLDLRTIEEEEYPWLVQALRSCAL